MLFFRQLFQYSQIGLSVRFRFQPFFPPKAAFLCLKYAVIILDTVSLDTFFFFFDWHTCNLPPNFLFFRSLSQTQNSIFKMPLIRRAYGEEMCMLLFMSFKFKAANCLDVMINQLFDTVVHHSIITEPKIAECLHFKFIKKCILNVLLPLLAFYVRGHHRESSVST